jgi:hypothetical protein
MIIARLTLRTDSQGKRHLVGRTTSSWAIPVGTVVVMRRVGDAYELAELAPRTIRAPDETALASFLPDGAEEPPQRTEGSA